MIAIFRWWVLLPALVGGPLAWALTVATYNVDNYTIADRMVNGVYRPAYPKPESEKSAVQAVVRQIAPDILAIQEMGSLPFLEELQTDLRRAGWNMPHAILLEAADPDRHVAILSRIPPREIRRHADVPISFQGQRDRVKRGVLEVTFATDAGDVTLFVVHLKSRRTERKDDPEGARQRELEAEAVRDLVLARFPQPDQARFIVCGDFNDTRNSLPVRSLLKRGQVELGRLLPAEDSRGESWTHHYRREETYSRIDYFLVSPLLASAIEGASGRIFDGEGAPLGSDHRAVYLRLKAGTAR